MADKWDQIRYYAGRGVLSPQQLPTTDAAQTQAAQPANPQNDLTIQTDPNAPPPTPQTPYQTGPEPNRLPPPAERNVFKTFRAKLKAADDKAARIPTPGGLGGWALALLFLVFAVVKFGGYTRLQLIWYALTGAADVGSSLGNVIGGILQVVNTNTASSTGGSAASSSAGQSAGSAAAAQVQQVPGGFTPRSVAGGGL